MVCEGKIRRAAHDAAARMPSRCRGPGLRWIGFERDGDSICFGSGPPFCGLRKRTDERICMGYARARQRRTPLREEAAAGVPIRRIRRGERCLPHLPEACCFCSAWRRARKKAVHALRRDCKEDFSVRSGMTRKTFCNVQRIAQKAKAFSGMKRMYFLGGIDRHINGMVQYYNYGGVFYALPDLRTENALVHDLWTVKGLAI